MVQPNASGEVRLDKWLHATCLFKTRSQASDACTSGRVKVNGIQAKPHRMVHVADRVEIERRDWQQAVLVKELRDKPIAKAQARLLYEDVSPPRPPVDRFEELLKRRPGVFRSRGSGRPTKKEGRRVRRLKDGNSTDD